MALLFTADDNEIINKIVSAIGVLLCFQVLFSLIVLCFNLNSFFKDSLIYYMLMTFSHMYNKYY